MSQNTHKAAAFKENATLDDLVSIIETETKKPGKDEILVKVYSCAVNPADWKHFAGNFSAPGTIPGSDSSGVVVEVGPDVKNFKVGDYVASLSHGGVSNAPLAGSFQEYAVFSASTSLKFPHLSVETTEGGLIDSFDKASAISSGLATVGVSFAHQFKWNFDDPQLKNEWVLIIGGTSATGFLAVQVAKKVYGVNVVTTANPKHTDLLKSLGADVVIDYNSKGAVKEITAAAPNLKYAFDCVSSVETYNVANDSLSDSREGAVLDNLLFLNENILKNVKPNVRLTQTYAYAVCNENKTLTGAYIEDWREIVSTHNKFWTRINEYVVDGTIKSLPLTLLPNGLESVNEALRLSQAGVHATKLVFKVVN